LTMNNFYEKYEQIASIWESELDKYSDAQLSMIPSPDSWSLGQVYEHLFHGTLNFQAKQIDQCLLNDANQMEKKTLPGKLIFALHAFPPVRVKVPPSPTYTPQQPEGRTSIKVDIHLLRKKLQDLAHEIDRASYFGKTQHHALGYLGANEWFQLIIMHFRHHLRQKKRIDLFFKGKMKC
jgi:hypothetical protein